MLRFHVLQMLGENIFYFRTEISGKDPNPRYSFLGEKLVRSLSLFIPFSSAVNMTPWMHTHPSIYPNCLISAHPYSPFIRFLNLDISIEKFDPNVGNVPVFLSCF